MINPKALLADLKAEVKRLQDDLRPTALADEKLRQEWQQARDAGRTAAAFEDPWLKDRVTQVAVAWVLATTFVRFAEDNGLLEYPFITGPDSDRAAQARELQEQYFQQPQHQHETDRDWLRRAFDAMSVSPAAKGLFEEHNPMWSILPTHEAASNLIAFWRKPDANGHLVHDFTDPEGNTRFLGDLYQDLSDDAKKTYALLQTPEFVEEFILNYTLDPAIEEFGLEPEPPYGHADLHPGLRVIDPACGSGHFLLGAFHRLLAAWEDYAPTTDKWTLINRSLQSVHGVDKNPYAAAIARFRLMLAAMRAGGVKRLAEDVDFPVNVAVGDSLLHGYRSYGSQDELPFEGDDDKAFTYRTEDIDDYIRSVHMLAFGSYHAVFGNPPYIQVDDKAESDAYRAHYASCYKQYSLSVPFAERIFKLALRGSVEGGSAGYTGQITANSFVKREFGKKLIDEFFIQVDLTHVIDTSGAYIPGHGTPTIILFGRWRYPRSGSSIRAVRSVRGEPRQPAEPANGLVWRAIVGQVERPGSRSEWVSVDDLDRRRYFGRHPWVLESGGRELVEQISASGEKVLSSIICRVGYYGDSHADQAFMLPRIRRFREMADRVFGRDFHRGQEIRNWEEVSGELALLPYDDKKEALQEPWLTETFVRLLWPYRTTLLNRTDFNGKKYRDSGRSWWEWHQLPKDQTGSRSVLAFSDLATHNHFVFDVEGDVYNRHAPIIRLKLSSPEDAYLELLSLLNSAIALYWLKQLSHDKGSQGINEGFKSQEWERFYEFSGANLEQFPIPIARPLELGRELDLLARQLSGAPSRDEHYRIRARMIALQEELDWSAYRSYGLVTDDEIAQLVATRDPIPGLKLGERAFEIVMARRIAAGELDTQWFDRHKSVPITEIPADWPDAYKQTVAARIDFIEKNRSVGLIERPEYKRRWQGATWEQRNQARLKSWLLDRCEDRVLWFGESGDPRPLTVSNLADQLRKDSEAVAVARQLSGPDADLFDVLRGLLGTQHVPYLAQYRYKGEGLVKYAIWQQTWTFQRAEDRGEDAIVVVPPPYKKEDFQQPSYWTHRDKLDFPKERFISYPGASPESDDSLLLGWAGWDHREQAHVLVTLIENRTNIDGWGKDRLTPLIAGLSEVMPWVRQWHSEPTEFGESWADAYDGFLTDQRERHSLTDDDLTDWNAP